jgi:hypothetical protein
MKEQLVKLEVWALTSRNGQPLDDVIQKLHEAGVYVDCFTCWNTNQRLRGKKQLKALSVLRRG